MDIGSIVAVKKLSISEQWIPHIKWLPVDNERDPYVIREIVHPKHGDPYAFLEEGILGYHYDNEIGIVLDYLIELLPPGSIEMELITKIPEYENDMA